MPYQPEYSHGLFPVRLDNGIWQKCHVSDVIVLDAIEGRRSAERYPHDSEEITTLSDRERR
jgi:hypothetical protein